MSVLQDGSLKLYLCVLLRQHPLVTEAVCLCLSCRMGV